MIRKQIAAWVCVLYSVTLVSICAKPAKAETRGGNNTTEEFKPECAAPLSDSSGGDKYPIQNGLQIHLENLTPGLLQQSVLQQAAGLWSQCELSGRHFPSVIVGEPTSTSRPVRVKFVAGPSPSGKCERIESFIPGSTFRESTISLYQRQSENGPLCNPLWSELAHALGHIFGLDDVDRVGTCGGTMMGRRFAGEGRTIGCDECTMAHRQWELFEEPEIRIPNAPPWIPRIDPCDFIPTMTGCDDGPLGRRLPEICIYIPGGTITTGPICLEGEVECDPPAEDTLGQNRGDTTVWVIEPRWDCFDRSGQPDRAGSDGGNGPQVAFIHPLENEIVSGSMNVAVSVAHATLSGEPVAFFVDDEPIELVGYQQRLPIVGLCDVGTDDPQCPDIGFSGTFDSRSLTAGVHELQVLAIDYRWPNPRMTWATQMFVVDNQSTPPPLEPIINVVRQWNGQTIGNGESFDFGSWSLSELPQARTFLVCNDGDASLTISNLSSIVTGTGFAKGSGPVGNIAPGNCSQMQLRFQPSTAGTYAGAANLQTNDPDTPTYTIHLTGTATSTSGDTVPPRLHLAGIANGDTISGQVSPGGWAMDAGVLGAASFTFEMDGQSMSLDGFSYGSPKPGACDANADLGSPNCPNVGWSGTLDSTQFSNGPRTFTMRVVDPSGNIQVRSVSFQIENGGSGSPPKTHLDKPSQGQVAFGQVIATGWAFDEDLLDSSSLAFEVDGNSVSLGNLVYGLPSESACNQHNDVNSPNCPNVRWRGYVNTFALANGWHTFTVTVTDASGSVSSRSSTFLVDNRSTIGDRPRARLELPTHGTTISGSYVFRGWAIDDDLLSSADITFELDGWPIFVEASYTVSRPDVCNVHADLGSPNCPTVGWTLTSGTQGLFDGNHILRLIVTDSDGNRTVFDRSFNTAN